MPFTTEVAPRIDVPALMRALKSPDEKLSYKAGAMLAHAASKHEEHREALAAQQDSIIAPLVSHLASSKVQLVHNATLILGQCLCTDTEFRQVFEQVPAAAQSLVSAMGETEPAVVIQATWAVRHFFSDPKCELSEELLSTTQACLEPLLNHADARIQKHATKLQSLVQQRRVHLQQRLAEDLHATARKDEAESMSAVQALTSIRDSPTRDTRDVYMEEQQCTQGLSVLATLTTELGARDSDEESSPGASPESSPMRCTSPSQAAASRPTSPSSLSKHSPSRGSRLAPWKKHSSHTPPWKKAMANRFSVKSR